MNDHGLDISGEKLYTLNEVTCVEGLFRLGRNFSPLVKMEF